ncbi:MAG: tetratricopeptide repeat protein [Actinomycetota bacterium]
MTPVIEVGEADFQQRVVDASREKPVVVDFWAGWCRPCLVLGPVLERLAEESGGRFTLAKVDVDANPALAGRFGVQGIPAVKAFRDGTVVSEFVGAQPEEAVRRFLEAVVPSEADELVAAAGEVEAQGALQEAEAAYRRVLESFPDHQEATVGLARVALAEGRVDEARALLARVPASPEARPLHARLVLADAATDGPATLREAAAAAVEGNHRRALELALGGVADGDRDAARDLMVRIFELLGDDDPLTREFRPRLARALF